MANSTFIQLPMDVTNPLELRRFLDKLVQQMDVAFGHRGNNSFATNISLVQIVEILNDHELRLDNIESVLPSLISDVQDLKDGELVVTTLVDLILGIATETILCNCTSNDINITLPDPTLSFSSGSRSKTISINKIDDTVNKVTILPFGGELITGDAFVELLYSSEIVNLITDGTDWYLGA